MAVAAALLRVAERAAALRLTVTGTLAVNGRVSANGKNGDVNSGGGSGGSLGLPPAPLPDQEPFPQTAAPATGLAAAAAADAFPWDTQPASLTGFDLWRRRLCERRRRNDLHQGQQPVRGSIARGQWRPVGHEHAFVQRLWHAGFTLQSRSVMARWSAHNRHSRC